MIRRPPRSTLDRSSAASDVYKRQGVEDIPPPFILFSGLAGLAFLLITIVGKVPLIASVSYTHLRAHETVLDLVCRLLLEKKKSNI